VAGAEKRCRSHPGTIRATMQRQRSRPRLRLTGRRELYLPMKKRMGKVWKKAKAKRGRFKWGEPV